MTEAIKLHTQKSNQLIDLTPDEVYWFPIDDSDDSLTYLSDLPENWKFTLLPPRPWGNYLKRTWGDQFAKVVNYIWLQKKWGITHKPSLKFKIDWWNNDEIENFLLFRSIELHDE